MSADRKGSAAASRATRRVPVILQQDSTECGAAALAMILEHHGRPTSLEECRGIVGAGRDGVTARAIVTAARTFGLTARGFSCSVEDLAHLPLPLIVHWRAKHFLVVERIHPREVRVVDPELGRRRIATTEFLAGFSGVALTFTPNEAFERRGTADRFTWRAYLGELLKAPGTRAGLFKVLLASLLLQVLGLALPLFTKLIVDRVVPSGQSDLMPILIGGLCVWILTQSLTTYLRSVVLLRLRNRVDAHVMLKFFGHLLALPFRYFQTRTTGDLLARLSSNGVLREIFTAQTVSILLDGFLVVSYLIALVVMAPLFGAIALSVALLQGLVIWTATSRMTHLAQQDLRAQSDSQSYLVEVLSGIATLKAAGAEDRAIEHWSEKFRAQLETSLKRAHFSVVVETALGALGLAAPLVLLLVGAQFVMSGSMTLGTMLALTALASSFLAPVTSLLSSAQNLQVVGAHLERIGDVLQARPEQDARTKVRIEHARIPIKLEKVSFRYAPASPDVMSDVTLAIMPGTKVALVGPTGSGKSTLGYLILGMHAPTGGVVRFGAHTIDEIDVRSLRRRFGVVLQDSALFAGTLHDNIAFHDPTLSREGVIEAARLACIHDEIQAMPMGYETLLSEAGSGLSGGQKQRLALARALARKPDVLFLDEATSHLDTATEAAIEAHLSRLGCTRIVIAHRLSTVRDADCIFVLRAGGIVESGTHSELVALGGHYAALAHEAAQGSVASRPNSDPFADSKFLG